MIGVIWIDHHAVIRLARTADHGLQVLNLVMLLTVSVIPFPTALLAHVSGSHRSADERVAVIVYGATMIAMSAAFNLVLRRVRAQAVTLPTADREAIRLRHRRFNAGLARCPLVTLLDLLSVPVFLAGLIVLAALAGGVLCSRRSFTADPQVPRTR